MLMKPKYQEIVENISQEIQTGRFKAGAKLPSEAVLLKRFDTSRITVSRAMRELQNAGLIDRVAGSGSYVRLREERSASLLFGLLIPDLGETEIFDAICQGIANAPGSDHALLWGHGMPANASKEEAQDGRGVKRPAERDGDFLSSLAGRSRALCAKEDTALELCRQFVRRKVSGVFFAPLEFEALSDKTNRKILATLQEANIPVVLLDRRGANRTERVRFDMVGINNWHAGYAATQHLIKLGCRHIGFLGYHAAEVTVAGRMAGYQDALRAAGLPVAPLEGEVVDPSASLDAFVCVNDRMAGQLMHTLLTAGTRIPEEIRIVGIDDASFAGLLPVPLTTVRQPCHEIGEAALRCMLERIDRPKGPIREILLDGQLVVRRSCGGG
jgi:DNA-binding LacI/PurR family transcriptional regulator/DNA-binding transcriptional regulator YhcF (GntR family)